MLTTALLAATLSTQAHATEIGNGKNLGLGIQLGSPTGLTGKYYLGGRRNAASFAIGSHYDGGFYSGLWLTGTYHFHLAELATVPEFTLPFRIGVGGFLATGSYGYGRYYRDDVYLGARVPFGLDMDFTAAPIQIYLEVAANLLLYPAIAGGVDAGLGFRYYF